MDWQTGIGLALIAAALALVPALWTSGAENIQSGFLSVPRGKAGWLRLLLAALTAYLLSVQLYAQFGYSLPALRAAPAAVVSLLPLALLGAGSIAALLVERRLGIVFIAAFVLLAAWTAYAPAPV